MSFGDANALLQNARVSARENRWSDAVADLLAALRTFPPYSFFVKAEKLIERLLASEAWRPRRTIRLALLSSSTTSLLAPVLKASAFRRGIQLDLYEGVFGNYRQEILDRNSSLHAFHPDFAVILVNHRDLGLPPSGGDVKASALVADLRGCWKALRELNPCHIVQVGFDSPLGGAWGSLEDVLPEGRRRVIARANTALSSDLPPGVSFLDANAIAADIGSSYWSDSQWHAVRQYPSSAALPRMADHIVAQIAAVLGLSAKVLAVDLDNTLWGGVIGEDLLEGIRIGPPSAEGEGYAELQRYLLELKQRGVLLAVCSKNNLADAELPFHKHDAMLLKRDDFAAFVANWDEKPTNLKKIAKELSLDLDCFVFLDDNPLERAMVRSQLPQVAVPECGDKPWDLLAALRRNMYFEAVTLTDEDLNRHEGYRGNAARAVAEADAPSMESFLSGLGLVARHGPIDVSTLTRTAQLINKTNQFNLTTRRYTEDQVRTMASAPNWWCHWFRLTDRFGDHGVIGVLLAKKNGPEWRIDTWLMSCRVLGRRMEEYMLACLLTAAKAEGAATVVGEYIPTEKNTLVSNLYTQMGFDPLSSRKGRYVFSLADHPISLCNFIRDESERL